MDGKTFDAVIKRLATRRLTRLTALRGLAAGSVAALTGVRLTAEEAGAKKNNNNNEKKIRICICTSADAATCKGQKKEKKKAKKTLRRNPCAYRGRCQSGVSGCTATAPISPPPGAQCNNNSGCGGGQVCEGGQCVDCTATSQCSGNQVCVGGRCQSPQPGPLTVCAPFTVQAVWTNDESDHDTYVFVPNEAGSTVPSPYINYSCNADDDDCEEEYPFVCVSRDAEGPGDEITTFYQLINGTYEYWIELDDDSPAGDLVIDLRNSAGTVVMSWRSPATPSGEQSGWHVFDVDGSTCIVTSVDQLLRNEDLPDAAHDPSTDVCPG